MIAAVGAGCLLMSAAAVAADAKVEEAIKAFSAVEADKAKLDTYCKMSKSMSAGGDGEMTEAQEAEAGKEMEGYMKTLGSDFEKAWETGGDVDPETADGKAYDAALEKLDNKCGA
jgi:hypothetical protein